MLQEIAVRDADRRLNRRFHQRLIMEAIPNSIRSPIERLFHRQIWVSRSRLIGLGRNTCLPKKVPLEKVIHRLGDRCLVGRMLLSCQGSILFTYRLTLSSLSFVAVGLGLELGISGNNGLPGADYRGRDQCHNNYSYRHKRTSVAACKLL